jgi:Restriction endonuclease
MIDQNHYANDWPPYFTGEYRLLVGSKNRLRLPDWRQLKSGTTFFQFPQGNRLAVVPASNLRGHYIEPENLPNAVRFSRTCKDLLSGTRIYPTEPTFLNSGLSNIAKERIQSAIQEIETAKQHVNKMSGREFERFLRRTLEAVGATVQSNIRIMGAEIDLMLLEIDAKGSPQFTIIEAKNHSKSGRSIALSIVLRLFGLSSAVKGVMPIKDALIVGTTRFTDPATHFANIYNVGLYGLEQLGEWLSAHALEWQTQQAPCYNVTTLSKWGHIQITEPFGRYGKCGDEVWMAGRLNSFNLWIPEAFEAYKTEDMLRKTELKRKLNI